MSARNARANGALSRRLSIVGATLVVAASLAAAAFALCRPADAPRAAKVPDAARAANVGGGALAPGERRVGVNLNGFQYWGTTLPFVDVFRHFDAWISQDDSRDGLANGQWDDRSNPIQVDGLGFPVALGPSSEPGHRQVATCLLLYESNGHYPTGDYVLLWEGTAAWEIAAGGRIVKRAKNRLVINVTSQNSGVRLRLVSMDEDDPVRAIRFVMPGHEATYQERPFNPDWLAIQQPFHAVRTMDWQRTNDSPLSSWAQRTTPSHITQARREGCSPEVLVELAHALPGKQIRVHIPHQADDDYVRRFAAHLAEHGPPETVWGIEYSNETWNTGFGQSRHVVARARADGVRGADFEAGQKWYARRSREIFTHFREAFGERFDEHVICILAGQNTGGWMARTILDFEDAHELADEYAIAPYFGGYLGEPGNAARTKEMSIEELHEAMLAQIDGALWPNASMSLPQAVAEAREVADEFGVRLVAYESGNHAFPVLAATADRELTALLNAADVHPGMEAVYTAYLEMLEANGLEMSCQFTDVGWPTQYGAWGMLRWVGEASSPKQRAILAFLRGGASDAPVVPRAGGDENASVSPTSGQPVAERRVLRDVLALDDPFRLDEHYPVLDRRTLVSPHASELAGHCHLCHQEVAAEWARSQHALAWIDEHFQESLEELRNPKACHGCHIPEPLHLEGRRFGSRPYARDPASEPWHFGVSCATCHLAGDGETWLGPSADAIAPHPVAQGDSFVGAGSNRLCIDCHRADVGPVLGIAQEYERSSLAAEGVRCIDCHLAPVERAGAPGAPVRKGRSHELLGPRDPLFLAQAFAPRAEAADDATRIVIANRAGHRVPGLIGRRLHFEARAIDPPHTGEPATLTIDHEQPLTLGGELSFELPFAARRVRLTARHEAPGWDQMVLFLDVELGVAR